MPAEQPVVAEAAPLTADALVDILARFADVSNRPDLDALMSLMTDEAGQTMVVNGGQVLPESKLAIPLATGEDT